MIGKIVKVYGKFYIVLNNDERINCVLRGKIRKDERLKRFSEPAATGDMVDFDLNDDGTGAINSIQQRKNVFSRKDKARGKEDIIASNLDQIVIIQSFTKPKLNLRFVDRLLVRGMKENIPVVLCVNKVDLATKENIDYVHQYYNGISLKVLIVSAKSGKGLKKLKKTLSGKLSIFVGYSGVGKTSVLNEIYPGLELPTSPISESTGKGKHTTTNVELIDVGENTSIMDTPGVREFGLFDIEPHLLGIYFNDFTEYIGNCRFSPCTHDHEPKCGVKDEVEKGNIFHDRYVSYLNILHSLQEAHDNLY
ncbi:ribosome small subunit-dependent GTPase A [Spirochaetota bacterium]